MQPVYSQLLKKIRVLTFITLLGTLPSIAMGANCSVRATPMNFGNYDGFSTTNLDSSSTITISCAPSNTSYTISLDGGLHGPINNRTMRAANGNDKLTYNLYTDASRSIIWGNGSGSTQTVPGSSSFPITVYGRIPPGQNAGVSSYNDIVTITVNF